MRLLDPRFKYTPSLATDIRATWKRFGFDARANEERRLQMSKRISAVTPHEPAETPTKRPLAIVRAS
jgi:hypothetical protein